MSICFSLWTEGIETGGSTARRLARIRSGLRAGRPLEGAVALRSCDPLARHPDSSEARDDYRPSGIAAREADSGIGEAHRKPLG